MVDIKYRFAVILALKDKQYFREGDFNLVGSFQIDFGDLFIRSVCVFRENVIRHIYIRKSPRSIRFNIMKGFIIWVIQLRNVAKVLHYLKLLVNIELLSCFRVGKEELVWVHLVHFHHVKTFECIAHEYVGNEYNYKN